MGKILEWGSLTLSKLSEWTLPMHCPGFESKQKIHIFTFSRRPIQKTSAATPLVNRKGFAKMCSTDRN